MPKVKSDLITIVNNNYRQDFDRDKLHLSFNINVNSSGLFYTNLDPNDIIKMESRGLIFESNKKGISGYFFADSIQELKDKIHLHCQAYFNVEEISREIVIKYSIATSCHYLVNDSGEVVPNGTYIENYYNNPQKWFCGSENHGSSNPIPFGMSVCATPLLRIISRYNDGTEKTLYNTLTHDHEYGENLNWLISVVKNKPPEHAIHGEIKYTEEAAKLFVDIIKWIFMTDQTFKDMFQSPERLQEVIEQKTFNNLLT